jgi:hypothetical protein
MVEGGESMRKLISVAVLAAVAFAALPATADVVDVAGTLYVDTSDNSVWQESNGQAGLQRTAVGNIAADSRLV